MDCRAGQIPDHIYIERHFDMPGELPFYLIIINSGTDIFKLSTILLDNGTEPQK